VILVIDTSSAMSALAILDDAGKTVEETFLPARSPELIDRMRAMASRHRLTKVAVATGPGSFTGLRVGVSFGLGLAMGLRIPIVPLSTLGIQASRSDHRVLALAEAGRGRVYFSAPGSEPGLAEPDGLSKNLPAVGWLQPATEAALKAAGLSFKPEAELRTFGAAAAIQLNSAREVPYDSLKLDYMQSFSARRA
jgi:tRNA threonylcarbamoyl adenosine modification protein YeaZ